MLIFIHSTARRGTARQLESCNLVRINETITLVLSDFRSSGCATATGLRMGARVEAFVVQVIPKVLA